MKQIKAPKVKPLELKRPKASVKSEVFFRKTKKGTWAIDFVIGDKVVKLKHEFSDEKEAFSFMTCNKVFTFFNENREEMKNIKIK